VVLVTPAYSTTGDRWLELARADEQPPGNPYCVFCDGVMVDEGDRVVCASCRTDALADPKPAAER